MARKKKHGRKHKREHIEVYHAKRRPKTKFPKWLKEYHKCRQSGKSKSFCKKKYYPK